MSELTNIRGAGPRPALSANGRDYWRSLEDLASTPDFRDLLEREFPQQAIGWSDDEDRHNLRAAIAFYPLFENAIRGARGRSVPDHMRAMGRLCAAFAAVAAQNPLATRRDGQK